MTNLTRPQSAVAWEHHSRAMEHLNRLAAELQSLPTTPSPSHPAKRWDANLGAAVAELRSALDALVWSYGAASARTSDQPSTLRFPIVDSYTRWQSACMRQLPGVPGPIRDRIRDVQPFTRAQHQQPHHPLILLKHLSNPGTQSAAAGPGSANAPATSDCCQSLVVDTPAGPAPALATLESLTVKVALILAHVGGETGRPVRSVQASTGWSRATTGTRGLPQHGPRRLGPSPVPVRNRPIPEPLS